MLGLGSSLSYGGSVAPPVTANLDAIFFLTTVGSANSGDTTVSPATTSAFDIRFRVGNAASGAEVFDESSDSASDFVLTNVTVENATTGAFQLLSSSVTMDNFVDVGGANFIYVFTDAGGPLDNLDLGSGSGAACAHNGTSRNNFIVSGTLTKSGVAGELFLQKSFSLTDSDA
jgi:hypothetical protein